MKFFNETRMMNRDNWINRILTALLVTMMTVSIAQASALTQPKADGWIGEQSNGYIGLVKNNAPADIKALVADVNAKRKAGYQQIATRQSTSLSEVEKVGGLKAIEKTLAGNYVKDTAGAWRKK
jgi:hypothetical protein